MIKENNKYTLLCIQNSNNKKKYFWVLNMSVCIADLQMLPMYFKYEFMSYQTQKRIKEII